MGRNLVFTGLGHLGNSFQSSQTFKRELTVLVVKGQALGWPTGELYQETDLLKNISPSKSTVFWEDHFPDPGCSVATQTAILIQSGQCTSNIPRPF